MMKSFFATLLVVAYVSPLNAQTIDPERLALARTYIASTQDDEALGKITNQSVEQIITRLEQKQPEVFAQKSTKIRRIVFEIMSNVIRESNQGLDVLVAETFTADEIRALQAFSQSQTGKTVLAKLPQLAAAMQPLQTTAMQNALGKLMKKLSEEGVQLR